STICTASRVRVAPKRRRLNFRATCAASMDCGIHFYHSTAGMAHALLAPQAFPDADGAIRSALGVRAMRLRTGKGPMHAPRDHAEIVVIWNRSAGSTEQAEFLRRQIAALHGIALVETDSREAAQRAVSTAVRKGMRRIIAAGGDGTVSALVEALADCAPTD